jgi:hypothetical protein
MPRRIQRKRTRGWRMPFGAIYVGRPSKWGNTHKLVQEDFPEYPGEPRRWCVISPEGNRVSEWGTKAEAAETAVDLFRGDIDLALKYNPDHLEPLRDSDLVCWCPLDQPCHADVLLELANK